MMIIFWMQEAAKLVCPQSFPVSRKQAWMLLYKNTGHCVTYKPYIARGEIKHNNIICRIIINVSTNWTLNTKYSLENWWRGLLSATIFVYASQLVIYNLGFPILIGVRWFFILLYKQNPSLRQFVHFHLTVFRGCLFCIFAETKLPAKNHTKYQSHIN